MGDWAKELAEGNTTIIIAGIITFGGLIVYNLIKKYLTKVDSLIEQSPSLVTKKDFEKYNNHIENTMKMHRDTIGEMIGKVASSVDDSNKQIRYLGEKLHETHMEMFEKINAVDEKNEQRVSEVHRRLNARSASL